MPVNANYASFNKTNIHDSFNTEKIYYLDVIDTSYDYNTFFLKDITDNNILLKRFNNYFRDNLEELNYKNSNEKHDYNYLESHNLNDIIIDFPLNNDVLRAGDVINIIGTVSINSLKRYTIEWGEGLNPKHWFTAGIFLTNDGNSSIINDTLAIWNTSFITESDYYTLKITILRKSDTLKDLINVKNELYIKLYLDKTLKEGWPVRIPWFIDEDENVRYFGGGTQVVVSDIDNDSDKELFVYFGGNPTTIYAFNSDGSFVNGWPVTVDNERMPGGGVEAPSIGDLDNDGFKEIVVYGEKGIYIYNNNGSLFNFINMEEYFGCFDIPSTAVLFDLNNDGNLEIIRKFIDFNEINEKLSVFDSTGHMMENWPQTLYDFWGLHQTDKHIDTTSFGFTQAIGNFDEDSDWEIVATACRNEYGDIEHPKETFHHEGRVFVFNIDGSILDGFPVDIDGEMAWSSPCVADIDNDGRDDIIIGTKMTNDADEIQYCNPNTGLYILDRYGDNLNGWPKLLGESIYTTPAIADFNNDGFLEIVVSTYGEPFNTYIFDYRGNVLPGWPQKTCWNDYRSPVVGDITGDGNLDVITTAGNGFITDKGTMPSDGGVYAWNSDGTLIEGFPKVTEIDAQASATIADIDSDGFVDIIASSDWDVNIETEGRKGRGSIYVWNMDIDFNPETMFWPMYHHDTQYSGLYQQLKRENKPPNKPLVEGPTIGKQKTLYTYTTFSTDPEDKQVFYWIDWGDGNNSGWVGPFESGYVISIDHQWNKNGSYEVKVIARDAVGYWSLWSEPLKVSMSKNKSVDVFNIWVMKLNQRFSFLESLM